MSSAAPAGETSSDPAPTAPPAGGADVAALAEHDRAAPSPTGDAGVVATGHPPAVIDGGVEVIIITYNERLNLPTCLEALQGWTRRVYVVDSGSTDGTQQIARDYGAEVVEHEWPGYAEQKNWALDHLPLGAPWVLIVDADEVITPALREKIVAITSAPPASIDHNGFFIDRLTYFLDEPIRHCGYFPSWNLRLFRRGAGRYEDRLVHEHVVIDDPVGYLDEPMLHHDRRGLEHFYAKHNRYSTLEAQQLFNEVRDPSLRERDRANVSAETRRRRWLKRHVMGWMPLPSLWRFCYMYFLRLGFLDGRVGYNFCRFIASYDGMVAFKLRALLRSRRLGPGADPLGPVSAGLATPEGDGDQSAAPPLPALPPLSLNGRPASTPPPADGPRSRPERPEASPDHPPTQTQPESSPWSFRGKITRALWMLVGRPLFRCSFHNWYPYRRLILRAFGARIGRGVAIRPTAHIEIPWMLDIDDHASIGDHTILYALGKIRIGKRSIISQYAHLCAGTHDYTDHTFRLLRTPITIGEDVWIGTDAFVGPGVTVGRLGVLGARSSAYRDVPEAMVAVGNPAKPIKRRELR